MGALSAAVRAWDLLKDFIFLGLRSNNREGTQLCPPRGNWIKHLLSMALHVRIRPSFPPQLVSPFRKLP